MRESRDMWRSCGCCRFWEPPPETHGSFATTGQCRLNAPASRVYKDNTFAPPAIVPHSWWPQVQSNDWCGQFIPGAKWVPPEGKCEFTRPVGEKA